MKNESNQNDVFYKMFFNNSFRKLFKNSGSGPAIQLIPAKNGQ